MRHAIHHAGAFSHLPAGYWFVLAAVLLGVAIFAGKIGGSLAGD